LGKNFNAALGPAAPDPAPKLNIRARAGKQFEPAPEQGTASPGSPSFYRYLNKLTQRKNQLKNQVFPVPVPVNQDKVDSCGFGSAKRLSKLYSYVGWSSGLLHPSKLHFRPGKDINYSKEKHHQDESLSYIVQFTHCCNIVK
jgi:hypothetical protein